MRTLTLQELRPLVHGALYVTQEKEQFRLRRFSPTQEALYESRGPEWLSRCLATAAIRLEFDTDATAFSFDYTAYDITRPCYFDITVDGSLRRHDGSSGLAEVTSAISFTLDGKPHRVCIYFPNLSEVRISNVRVSKDAALTPVCRKLKLYCVGDSITQGYNGEYPSQSYANLLADMLGAEELNQAIGGDRFIPQLLEEPIDFAPDVITVAYGTNDWSHGMHDVLARDAAAFFSRLRALYPTAKIFAVTPIWRNDHRRITDVGTFEEAERIVRESAEAVGAIPLNGYHMIPHRLDFFEDQHLHPNDFGFRFYATALYLAMQPYLK